MTMQQISGTLFQWLNEAGAEGDLVVNEVRSLSLKALDGELEEHSVNSGLTLGLRVIRDDQVGTAYSEATDAESLRFMLDQALTNARFSQPRQEEQIRSDKLLLSDTPAAVNPDDDSDIEEKIDFVIALESRLRSFADIRNVPYNGLSDAIRSRSVYSSTGCAATMTARTQMAYAAPLAAVGDKTSMESAVQAGRRFQDLDLDALIQAAYDKSTALLDGGSIKTGRYDVLFDVNVQAQLFGAFASMWSGKWAQEGINPFREQIGDDVFDARLTMVDRPLNTEGLAYRAFDDEGMPTAETVLVEGGRLATLAHNTATASHFGLTTTGHAARSAKSSLNVGLHQLHLLPGPDSDATITRGEYLQVTRLDGLHSGTNPISGEFSCGASGFLCRDGERRQAVRGITVAGNLYRMLSNVVSVSDTAQWTDSRQSCMATVRFADLAISG